MPEPREAQELAQRDAEAVLRSWLDDQDPEIGEGAGFRILEEFARDAEGFGIWNQDSGTVAVPWAFTGRHTGNAMGFLPTGNVVELRGVTMVHTDDEDRVVFSRFIDWISGLAQIGVGIFNRPVLDDPANAQVDAGPPQELLR